jgi:hypothetical protein
MDAARFAQRHEQNVIAAEPHDLGQNRGQRVPCLGPRASPPVPDSRRFDAANVADGSHGAFRLDDQSDDLLHQAAVFHEARPLDPLKQVLETS